MRKGFTMIELIFVIVILGILAAVAIPRLAATRDDAEVSKASTNLSTVVSNITAYYTSKTTFASTMKDMTNVTLGTGTAANDGVAGNLQIKGKPCINIEAVKGNDTNTTAYVRLTQSDSGKDPLCKNFVKILSVEKMLTATSKEYGDMKGVYPVGGSNVVY